ncbi:MAG: peptide deformylase [Solobacterium sp.]|nr:peptide deformylase [Solobacterium sp.]
MIRPIVREPLLLSRTCPEAVKADVRYEADLSDTLLSLPSCLGIAANMIGIRKRIIAIRVGSTALVMFNPVILSCEGEYEAEEGCVSLPGIRKTRRFRTLQAEYRDGNWKLQKGRFSGVAAQVIQHEIDHLNGILI